MVQKMLVYLKQLILEERFFRVLFGSWLDREEKTYLSALGLSAVCYGIFAQSLPAWIFGAAHSALGLGYMIRSVSLCFDDVLKTVYSLDALCTATPKSCV